MKAPVPSLSSFITEPYKALDYLFGCFFKSEESQSTVSLDAISSLPYLVKVHGNDPATLANEVKDSLRFLLNRYFDTVVIDSSFTIPEDAVDNRYTITTSISVVDNNKSYNVSKLVDVKNSIIVNIIEQNI